VNYLYWSVWCDLLPKVKRNLDVHVCMSCLLADLKSCKNTLFVHLLHKSNINQEITPFYALLTYAMDIVANEAVSEHSREIARMIREITDFLEGSPCFLCQTTSTRECIWDEIGDDILARGLEARIWFESSEGSFTQVPSIAECDKAAR